MHKDMTNSAANKFRIFMSTFLLKFILAVCLSRIFILQQFPKNVKNFFLVIITVSSFLLCKKYRFYV